MVIEQDLNVVYVDNEANIPAGKLDIKKNRSTTILEKIYGDYLLIPQKYNIKC